MAAGALALVAACWGALDAWREERRVRERVDQARIESQATRAKAEAFEARSDPAQRLALQALLSAEAPPTRVVSDLAGLLPPDVRLESLRLVYGSRLQVEMRVSAKEAAAYDEFLGRLERSPAFSEVLPGDENRDGELHAVVRAVWQAGA